MPRCRPGAPPRAGISSNASRWRWKTSPAAAGIAGRASPRPRRSSPRPAPGSPPSRCRRARARGPRGGRRPRSASSPIASTSTAPISNGAPPGTDHASIRPGPVARAATCGVPQRRIHRLLPAAGTVVGRRRARPLRDPPLAARSLPALPFRLAPLPVQPCALCAAGRRRRAGRESPMALNAILRVFVTLAAVTAAALVGWWLWDFYMWAPWTRDARVLSNVVEVAPDVSGLITDISVIDNQRVAKGDVLFVIDRERFKLAVEQAQAAVAQNEATAKLSQDNADRDARVMSRDSRAISAETAETSRSKASEAAAALQLARAQLATAQLNLQRSTVRSPVNGSVTNLTATVGDYATRGTGVLALVDQDSFYVYAYFMETKLPAIRIGNEAEVRLMAGGTLLRGTVQGLSRAIADPSARGGLLASVDPNFEWIRLAQRIPVRIALEKLPTDVELVAGMSATVVVCPPP